MTRRCGKAEFLCIHVCTCVYVYIYIYIYIYVYLSPSIHIYIYIYGFLRISSCSTCFSRASPESRLLFDILSRHTSPHHPDPPLFCFATSEESCCGGVFRRPSWCFLLGGKRASLGHPAKAQTFKIISLGFHPNTKPACPRGGSRPNTALTKLYGFHDPHFLGPPCVRLEVY